MHPDVNRSRTPATFHAIQTKRQCAELQRFGGASRMTAPALVWLRQDLRIEDNAALRAAIDRKGPVIPIYIWSPCEEGEWAPGGAGRYWLHHALHQLQGRLKALDSRLIIRAGDSLECLQTLIAATGAGAVLWNRRYEPAAIARDTRIKKALKRDGIEVQSFKANLLFEPHEIANKAGKPFKVYTPFWRHLQNRPEPPKPLSAPKTLATPERWPRSIELAELALEPRRDWADGIARAWQIGNEVAALGLERFLRDAIDEYPIARDQPAANGVSRISPYLHFGQISPRQVWHAVRQRERGQGRLSPAEPALAYLRQLAWREFAHHLLYHFPHTATQPMRPEYARFPWQPDDAALRAWQRGRTGYPIVDAGMRELWNTGWMHNRVRMVVASFLIKDLLIHWIEGARWFWDTLVDADLANNTMGWQWTAGCGADAAPYFRVFNPVSQGERFDARGDYVRTWVPELTRLPNALIHKPWQAPAAVLDKAGVILGTTYPRPIVDHATARQAALAALKSMNKDQAPQSTKTI